MRCEVKRGKGKQRKASSRVKGRRLQSRCSLLSEVTGVEVLVVERGHHDEMGSTVMRRGRLVDVDQVQTPTRHNGQRDQLRSHVYIGLGL